MEAVGRGQGRPVGQCHSAGRAASLVPVAKERMCSKSQRAVVVRCGREENDDVFAGRSCLLEPLLGKTSSGLIKLIHYCYCAADLSLVLLTSSSATPSPRHVPSVWTRRAAALGASCASPAHPASDHDRGSTARPNPEPQGRAAATKSGLANLHSSVPRLLSCCSRYFLQTAIAWPKNSSLGSQKPPLLQAQI